MNIETVKDKARGLSLALAGGALFLIVALIAPHQVGLVVLAASRVLLGGFIGYWADRVFFPDGRPHAVNRDIRHWAWIRRAIIVAGCALAMALSV